MSIARNLAALSGLIVLLCCATAVAQPANDECTGAFPVTAGVGIPFDTLLATNTTPAPVGTCGTAAPDVWFSYTAACTGSAAVETTSYPAGGVDQDTIVQVFGGACGALTNLGCDDDEGPVFLSAVTFPVTSGTTYMIRVSGWGGTTGTGTFDITCYAPPANDDCLAPVALAASVPTAFSTAGATNTTPALTCAGSRDVWFEYTASSTGPHGIALSGLTFAVGELTGTFVRPSVYSGACGALTQVACITTHAGVATLTAGTSYRIRVGMVSTTTDVRAEGLLTISLPVPEICNDGIDNDLDALVDCLDPVDCCGTAFCPAVPANNLCASAQVVGLGSPVTSGNVMCGTNDGTATCGSSTTNRDVWFSFTAPFDGSFAFSTCGTHDAPGLNLGMDTVIATFPSCGGVQITCNDDAVSAGCAPLDNGVLRDSRITAAMTSGQSVLIRVTHFGTPIVGNIRDGAFVLNVTGTPSTEIDCTNGIDDDLDGNTDCADTADCSGHPTCVPGDHCITAIAVIAGANPIDTTVYTDSAEPDPTGCTNSYGQNVQDGWYAFTAPSAGTLTVDTCDPAGFDTDLAIYSGSCASLSLIACDGDGNGAVGCQGFDSRISTVVSSGTHLIRVGGWEPGESGPGLLNIAFVGVAAEICDDLADNDLDGFIDCADADCVAHPACLACPTFVTQNNDPDLVTVNIAACAAGSNHTENGYFRSFDTSTAAFGNCPNGVRVTAVEYGLGTNTAPSGSQGARVRLWLDSNGGAPDAGMTLMSEEILTIATGTPTGVQVVPLTVPAAYPAGATVVAEFFMEDGTIPLNILRMGGNALGNSATAYIHAPGCGIAYTLLTGLGVTNAPVLNLVTDDQGAGPAGDECIFAVNVGVGANPIDTGGFTDSADPDPTGCPSFYGQNTHDGWYTFTAPGDGTMSVDTCDAAGFDTDLAIYGGGCGALSLIACNGDGSGLAGCQIFYSRITNLIVEGGESYIIRVGGYDSAESGPGTLNIAFTPTPPALNELRIDQPGTDNDEFVELAGQAQSLTGLWIIVIGDGSPAPNFGVVESVIDLTGASLDSSGFFVVAEDSFTLAGGVADLEFPAASNVLNFENSDNVTFMLVRNFTGALAQDLDTNDDGVLESSPWSEVVDCVSVIETVGTGALVYCSNHVGPDGTFAPGAAERCPDATGDFFVGAFDTLLLTDTPGSSNSCLTPPANDECVTAVEAFVGDNDFFNASATNSPEPFGQTAAGCGTGIGHDIWFHFTAPGNGTVVLDTCGLISFDSNVEMYSGACGALVVVGGSCDTAGCPGFSATSDPIPVSAGATYLIRVGAWNADPGGFGTLAIGFNPQGDECADPITAVDGANAFDTTIFTNSADAFDDAQCVGTFLGAMAKDGWWSYTSAIDGTMDVSLCGGSTHDSDLVIYTGACGALTQIACNGDSCSLTSEILDVPVTAGTTYSIRLGSWSPSSLGASGTFTVAVAPLAVPPTAAFTVGPLEGIAPLDVVLTDASDNGLDPAATIDVAWGDGDNDNDLPVGSVVNHTYAAGTWTASVTITNLVGSDSLLSPSIVAVAMGDCNKDGSLDVADAIGLAAYLFSGGAAPNCATACDTNGDGLLDLADAVYTLMWLFSGGSPPVPAAPGSGC